MAVTEETNAEGHVGTSPIEEGSNSGPAETANPPDASSFGLRLGKQEKEELDIVDDLRLKLKEEAKKITPETGPAYPYMTLGQVLERTKLSSKAKAFNRVASTLKEAYSGRPFQQVDEDIQRIMYLKKGTGSEFDTKTKKTLFDLQIVNSSTFDSFLVEKPPVPQRKSKKASKGSPSTPTKASRTKASTRGARADQVRVRRLISKGQSKPVSKKKAGRDNIATLDQQLMRQAKAMDFPLDPLVVETSKVPTLSHDLSRVLFNPGVYQLQDPRSRVWNFDPYLGSLMPVSEFNYDALNKYVNSSEDSHLRDVAQKQQKRYVGSTSSMSGVLSHFHFLLSGWRKLNLKDLTRGFQDDGESFTKIQRGPTAIFLRYQDGVYAVDADKEFDSANILMSLGRSMEKLLTHDKEEFERFRKTENAAKDAQFQQSDPEAYHYSTLGNFLLRSQLDAHDSRLPGTGMFDLKTRAVAAVRMMIHNHEVGAGYQIKARHGTWESYEREYYDMMRSAFLKYSLQVRMGRMDGIFVAYHNTERLFGFQYVPLSEMDYALHGQTHSALGDQEFRLSVKLLNDIFDEATSKYPNQSLRFHFEAREPTTASPAYMYVFAEPVTDEEIVEIQNSKKAEIRAYEERIFNPPKNQAPKSYEDEEEEVEEDQEDVIPEAEERTEDEAEKSKGGDGAAQSPKESPTSTKPKASSGTTHHSNAANVAFLDSILTMDLKSAMKGKANEQPVAQGQPAAAPAMTDASTAAAAADPSASKPILAWKLHIRNIVNGMPVPRPENLTASCSWSVQYTLSPMLELAGRRNYELCKKRRKAHLEAPEAEDAVVSFYIRRLISMSQSGAKWRRSLDQQDALRDRVVLYGERGAT